MVDNFGTDGHSGGGRGEPLQIKNSRLICSRFVRLTSSIRGVGTIGKRTRGGLEGKSRILPPYIDTCGEKLPHGGDARFFACGLPFKMAVRGMSSLDFCRWRLFIVIALVWLGSRVSPISAQGKVESHATESHSPSVDQCRVHVEAALNKYWDNPEDDSPSLLPESDESDEETRPHNNPGIHRHNPPVEDKSESAETQQKSEEQSGEESLHEDTAKEDESSEKQNPESNDSHEVQSKEEDDTGEESAEVDTKRKGNPSVHKRDQRVSDDKESQQDNTKEDTKSEEEADSTEEVRKNPPTPLKPSIKAKEVTVEKRGAYRTGGSDSKDVPEKTSDSGRSSEEDTKEVDDDDEDDDEIDQRKVLFIRTRQHIDEILGLNEIGTPSDKEEQQLTQTTLKELKRNYDLAIKPLEAIYKFKDISTRILGDAEIFAKPVVLLLGPWSSGKSSIINYLLGTERTPSALKTGPEPTDTQFTVVQYGEKPEVLSGTELAADWPFSSVQKFGQSFLDHFRGIRMPHRLLQKITIVDTPGIIENRKQDKGYPFNDAFQWFIDRADAIYIVFDPAKLEIGSELEAILDQLKGREAQIRFILNKADTIRRSDVMKVNGQLFWNLSPLLGSSEAPVIYTVSLMTKPYHPGAPARFLLEQEKSFLQDLRQTMDRRVENKVSYARRHAVRVRNHAKMVDCYLATYNRHKSIFSNKKKVAESITENPNQYSIYAGLSSLTNVSRYDLPDPEVYKVFFRLNPLFEFKPLTATCSYFKGCPLDKLDIAIAYDLPELLGKFKKQSNIKPSEWADEKGR